MTKKKAEQKDAMDGAFFLYGAKPEETPVDFMVGPDGKRPGELGKPSGKVRINLEKGTSGVTLPPRFIWEKGHWLTDVYPKATQSSSDWNTWAVSGEGTPGNYEERHYLVPEEIGKQQTPDHPADWPKRLQEGPPEQKWKSSASTSSGLPYNLCIRCPGCGHFFRTDDLAKHAKSDTCPAKQEDPAMWALPCECHEGDILMSATILPGFPIDPKKYASKKDDEDAPLDEALLKQAESDMPDKKAPDNVRGDTEAVSVLTDKELDDLAKEAEEAQLKGD